MHSGVATFRAAAMAEGKDPDKAVVEARAKVINPDEVLFWTCILHDVHFAKPCPAMLSPCCMTVNDSVVGGAPLLQGEIPTLTELSAPWGPKPYKASEADAARAPAKFAVDFSPLKDITSAA
jgi:hypothetical protein